MPLPFNACFKFISGGIILLNSGRRLIRIPYVNFCRVHVFDCFQPSKEEIYRYILSIREVGKTEDLNATVDTTSATGRAKRAAQSTSAEFNRDQLERYGYFIEMMNKYPRLYKVVYEDYIEHNESSGYSANKVGFFFKFQVSFFLQTNAADFKKLDENLAVIAYTALADHKCKNGSMCSQLVLLQLTTFQRLLSSFAVHFIGAK